MANRQWPVGGVVTPISSYRELTVWREGIELAEACYRLTKTFPREELFGTTSQIRRASASIPANIAEGWGRNSTGDYLRFLRIAQGSLKELETHLILAARIGLANSVKLDELLQRTEVLGKRLLTLDRALNRRGSANGSAALSDI